MSKTPKIEPEKMSLDHSGLHTSTWFARLPDGMTADALKEPAIWSKICANNQKAVRKHDRIYCAAFDESFAVETRVTAVSITGLTLALNKIIKFAERTVPLFADDMYRIIWAGDGYAVQRLEDQRQMGGVFGSEALAINHLKQLYPVTANG